MGAVGLFATSVKREDHEPGSDDDSASDSGDDKKKGNKGKKDKKDKKDKGNKKPKRAVVNEAERFMLSALRVRLMVVVHFACTSGDAAWHR